MDPSEDGWPAMGGKGGRPRKAPKLRLRKRRILKPDGRYLIFYEFEPEEEGEKGAKKRGRKQRG